MVHSGDHFRLAIELLLRFSITCVSMSEVCPLSEEHISANANVLSKLLFTRQIFPGVSLRHLGWWWRKLGPIAILTLTLLRVLPFFSTTMPASWNMHMLIRIAACMKRLLHIWTVLGASFLEFMFTGRLLSTRKFIENGSLVSLEAPYFVLQLLSRH